MCTLLVHTTSTLLESLSCTSGSESDGDSKEKKRTRSSLAAGRWGDMGWVLRCRSSSWLVCGQLGLLPSGPKFSRRAVIGYSGGVRVMGSGVNTPLGESRGIASWDMLSKNCCEVVVSGEFLRENTSKNVLIIWSIWICVGGRERMGVRRHKVYVVCVCEWMDE